MSAMVQIEELALKIISVINRSILMPLRVAAGLAFATCLTVGATPEASASLISENSSYGANTLTLDTATGLEWLDVPLTLNRSINDISAKFGAGQEFAGFRYATHNELHTLFLDAGVSVEPLEFSTASSDIKVVENLIALLGQTFDFPTPPPDAFGTLGFTASAAGGSEFALFNIQPFDVTHPDVCSPACASARAFDGAVSGQDFTEPTVGSFLVLDQQAAVPEPSTWAMMILGFAGLGFMAFRRQTITPFA